MNDGTGLQCVSSCPVGSFDDGSGANCISDTADCIDTFFNNGYTSGTSAACISST